MGSTHTKPSFSSNGIIYIYTNSAEEGSKIEVEENFRATYQPPDLMSNIY